jgi:hypothetical protein
VSIKSAPPNPCQPFFSAQYYTILETHSKRLDLIIVVLLDGIFLEYRYGYHHKSQLKTVRIAIPKEAEKEN